MKKIGLICIATLTCLSLAACGNSASQKLSDSSSSSVTTTKAIKHHKKHKENKKEPQSSSSSVAPSQSNSQSSQTTTQQSSQNSSQQQAVQSAQQSNSQQANNGQINNAQDALNAAKAKYGDGNGNYHWTIMYDADTNQPIQNPDGSYFVKAIDPTQGTMTGTAQSVNVYPDGSMTNN
ncbi:hypothetical protein DKZ23_03910 [Limosilactobacillus reuteri]|uniref:Lipoprotein n=1 Tax=Limosilactobacillus reuteri TaxID=1598 RepID=A0A317GJM9_LIMRT|nr:hypothetical protein [Limosilactobacillus reuteri]MCH5385353.1 hypothetical protein [Limosilactobacillus reuteri]PWT47911.1 hypothetical protein DKZ23_03910 [Limosilactobacillus reuteri]PWT52375.1 hypothetical protein DKZ33_03610 [Limosilactobacillus reuteri]PWT63005.1 hypothetical protein DKZ32_03810 [Limosilactobacillus reuteri]